MKRPVASRRAWQEVHRPGAWTLAISSPTIPTSAGRSRPSATSTTVPTRLLTGAFEGGFGYQGAAGERGVQSLYDLIRHASAGDAKGAAKAGIDVAGIGFHLPAHAIDTILSGYDWASENGKNPIPAMVFGKPPKK